MRRIREITAKEENFRTEPMFPGNGRFHVIRRDPVEPAPVGTVVAMWFRVAGYDADCDGSLMARLEGLDAHGESTGWNPTHLGLLPDDAVELDSPSELYDLAAPSHEKERAP